MTAGEFNELAQKGKVWAKISSNFNSQWDKLRKLAD